MTTTVYDARGLVGRTLDAKAQPATYSYNARGEQSRCRDGAR